MNELETIEAVKRGDSGAFARLLAAHRVMVTYHAKRWGALLSYEDLYQAACVAVWQAALAFRSDGGASFATYARRRVRAGLSRCVRQWARDVNGAPGLCRAEHYDAPAPGAEDDDGCGLDAYAVALPGQEETAVRGEVARRIRETIAGLSPRDAAVVEARWFTSDEPLSMTETAAAVGYKSKEHVQQVHQDAVLALSRRPALRALARAEGWPLGRKPVDPRDVHAKPKKVRREPDADEIAVMREKKSRGIPAAVIGAEHGLSYQRVRAIVEKVAA